MRFDSSISSYLIGDRFSNGLDIRISKREKMIPDRIIRLEELVSGKRVIHFGCVDHLPLIEQKIKNNCWLHERLSNSAEICLGVDINCEGIEYLRKELHYKNVICADVISNSISEINAMQWDYVVMGEIIEHVDNPVAFLEEFAKRYSSNVDRVLITVPNAFSIINFKNGLNHKECINTDHRYWFTPYTLGKVVTRAGLKVISFEFCEGFPQKSNLKVRSLMHPWETVMCYMLKFYPSFRDTLLLEAQF